MCGIAGEMKFGQDARAESGTVRRMCAAMTHRGPDDEGIYTDGPTAIGMRRLSIIDVSGGHQPISNENGTIWIVFNGEIYNHAELRRGLEQRGHRYRTNSDTESIVHLYEEYGRDCVQHLRGMFAFAIWDRRLRRLFIARDRLGIKPLYYFYDDKKFIFGSEIKAILAYPGIKPEFNQSTLAEYLAFGYIAGPETMFTGIRKLLPGNRLEIDEAGKIKIEPYWDLSIPAGNDARPRAHYIRTYRELLEECVASHLMSDVPLGVFLSGGLDSSAVAALTSKIRGEQIETFSVGYGEEAYSELPYAREVARHIGSRHHEVRLSRQEFFDSLPKLIWHEDEPIVWPSSVSLYSVARLARERVTVVLTGEGSDETLAGYTRYAWTLLNSRMDRVYRSIAPSALRDLLRRGIAAGPLGSSLHRKLEHTFLVRDGASWPSFYFDNFYSAFSSTEAAELLTASAHATAGDTYRGSMQHWEHSRGDLLHRLLYTDIKTYLVELLMKQDQMSMAASIESRVPFLDHVLVEFAATIPAEFSTRGLAGKHILKAAVQDLLPKSIVYRQKMGFPTPWACWLLGPQLDELDTMLLGPRTTARGLFRREVMQRLFAEHRARHRDHGNRIWRLLNLETWMRVFLDGEMPARDQEIHENLATLPAPPAASV